ncbi:hypothetical protein UFOVP1384_31 [uncultured Caudovirales phage]|uniref:DUF8033 domain-containing protein n=1 Tax=uncultured Caudovirales phage TaxID=2100421 RepID=A0A6J5S6J2_9CAUD|nr:hypothetical protein UFOVP1384_31 [uncultured Caudovirales phage]
MKISNFTNSKGNKVANQFIINDSEFTLFQSYDSVIIKTTFEDGKRVVYLDSNYWDYSKTTGKYRNLFLGENKKATELKIKNNIYKLINLN